MNRLTVREMADVINGDLTDAGTQTCTGISIDTRTLQEGDAYFALAGERFDGHAFVSQAIAKKASVSVLRRSFARPDAPCILVDDPLDALQRLAAWYRLRFKIPVIAITGSHGKTTTKDLVTGILRTRYSVHATHENLNGLIGVPMTILGLQSHHEFLVIEVGISKPGEMDRMAAIVKPTVAILTCIAPAHTEYLISPAQIAAEKSKLFSFLFEGGMRVLNAHDPLAVQYQNTRSLTFGFDVGDVRGEVLELHEDRSIFAVTAPHRSREVYALPLPGTHNVLNALAALSAIAPYCISRDDIQKGFDNVVLAPHRSNVLKIGGYTIIDDTYNAAPISMKCSIEMLSAIRNQGRAVAVLGDMLELGSYSVTAHRNLGTQIANVRIDLLICFGQAIEETYRQAVTGGVEAYYYPNAGNAKDQLLSRMKKGDTILVKASRSMHADQIVKELLEKLQIIYF